MIIFTIDKPRLKRHFDKDPVLFAYHIGDLDDFHFDFCQWAALYHPTRAKIEEVILTYTGCKMPTILAFGITEAFNQLLNESISLLPPKFHIHFQKQNINIFKEKYKINPMGTHLKMKLEKPSQIKNHIRTDLEIIKLKTSDKRQIELLYKKAYPENYFTDRMLNSGKYFAVIENKQMVSISGVHVNSDEYNITVLGNITTHPDYRGKGYATAVTAKLLDSFDLENRLICLNVKKDNLPAIKTYEKLGFVVVHEYEEAIMEIGH